LAEAAGDVAGAVTAVLSVPGAGCGVGDAEQVGEHLPVDRADQREPGAVSGGACAGDAQPRFFATRPVIAKALSRCGHILLPVVLIGIGLFVLIEGNAFGL
jgi:hypothetical protein